MTTWYTSDLHLGHRMVARNRWETAEREYPLVSEEDVVGWHDRMLANNWDSVVGKDDTVWVLGDLSLQGARHINPALEWVSHRLGRKNLVAGNHDGCHPGVERKESGKWFRRYLEVFEEVVTFKRLRIADRVVLLSHFPYQGGGDHTAEERYTQWRLPYHGEWLLHGHTHSSDKMWDGNPEAYPGAKHQIHVGVDAWNYTPVSQDEIIKLMEKYESQG